MKKGGLLARGRRLLGRLLSKSIVAMSPKTEYSAHNQKQFLRSGLCQFAGRQSFRSPWRMRVAYRALMNRRRFIDLLGLTGSIACASSMQSASGLALSSMTSDREIATAAADRNAIAIHPENPKYFLFRGGPLVLVAATEHYGSVINRRFDFTRYLQEAARVRQTVSRLFLLYRELQSPRNPYSPLKAESPDFVSPYPRQGPGKAIDGEPKYNLDEWNPEYIDRLHRFLSLASTLGIVVELTVFSNTYSDRTWDLNPLRDKNNNQGIGTGQWQEYTSLKDQALVERLTCPLKTVPV